MSTITTIVTFHWNRLDTATELHCSLERRHIFYLSAPSLAAEIELCLIYDDRMPQADFPLIEALQIVRETRIPY